VSADDVTMPADRPEVGGSVRVDVARAALQAALEAPAVLGSDSGPRGLRVTADPPFGLLVGVSATAQADGRYAVDLSLVASMVPLPELAEEVRDRVRKRAGREHVEDVLGSINVEFASVVTAEEFAAAAAEQQVQEALAAEEIAAATAVAEDAAEPSAPESGTVEGALAGAVQSRGRTGPAPEDEQRVRAAAAGARPPGRDAAALAARQAVLATDQAALAAKQAALAAEQAALAAAPGVALASPEGEREPGSTAEHDEEQET
jgi:hypothetical protein